MNKHVRGLFLATTTLTALALSGCTLASDSTPAATSAIGNIRGAAHGGNQPVTGMQIYVYAANTSAYGAASQSLLTSLPGVTTEDSHGNYYVTTDGGGNFALTGDYTCTVGQEVYLYGVGGNTGAGPNTNAGLLAILGQCPISGSLAAVTPYVWMNEVTTVAAAYAFAGFAVDATHVSDDEAAAGGNAFAAVAHAGMANAFGNSTNLVNIANGSALTTTGNDSADGITVTPPAVLPTIIVPQAQINTIADILAACVNTTSTAGSESSNCSTLLGDATSNGTNTGTVPTDTATAAINIAHYPAANVPALYALINGQPAFIPDTAAAPADYTISILYPQGGTGTVGLAADSLGNAYGVYGGGGTVYRITPGAVETALITVSSSTEPRKLAIDASNNVWVPSDLAENATGAGSIYMFTPTATTPVTYTAVNTLGTVVGSLISVTFDSNGYLWALGVGSGSQSSPYVDQATLLNVGPSTAPAASATAVTYVNTPANPAGIGVDTLGNLGLTSGTKTAGGISITNSSVTAGTTLTATTGGGMYSPGFLTPDASGNFWIANDAATGGNTVIPEVSSTGAPVSTFTITPANGGSNTELFSGEFDGLGNYYTGGNTYASGTTSPNIPSIYVLNSSGAQIAVYSPPTYYNEYFAVDPSGNLWFGGNKTIGEMIGIAAPKITPIVTATFSGRTVVQTLRP